MLLGEHSAILSSFIKLLRPLLCLFLRHVLLYGKNYYTLTLHAGYFFICLLSSADFFQLLAVCLAHRGLPVGFLLLRYSVLFTVEYLSLLYLLVIS